MGVKESGRMRDRVVKGRESRTESAGESGRESRVRERKRERGLFWNSKNIAGSI